MKRFTGNSQAVAQFVRDLLLDSRFDSVSITITAPAKYAACSVVIATDTSLEEIAEKKARVYSLRRTNISHKNTQDG